MVAQALLGEYLQEIREEVCSRCIERPAGGPPCEPLGKNCGVELHLEQLIDSIHQVQSNRLQPYLEHNRHEICETCSFLHSSICPCPMDYLSLLIVEAVEAVDERRRQRGEVVQRETPADRATLDEIRQLYRDAVGTWTGCDWETSLGPSKLNVEGLNAAQAAAVAPTCDNPQEFEDWITASHWLARIEHHARLAQRRAKEALQAAEEGRWQEALDDAEWAWSLEFATGRPLRRAGPATWQPMRDCIEAAAMAHVETVAPGAAN